MRSLALAPLSALWLAWGCILLGGPDWAALCLGAGWMICVAIYQRLGDLLDLLQDMTARRRDG